jgi:hypothetical protein
MAKEEEGKGTGENGMQLFMGEEAQRLTDRQTAVPQGNWGCRLSTQGKPRWTMVPPAFLLSSFENRR